ncbi:MAG: hypothetical protein L6R42_002210 [Xanthoria sp. 1 TBL-2021]|nr:MAG: hypothetical protein L6R42_002210 [Xanthoria sp. 1 TBL-2021]
MEPIPGSALSPFSLVDRHGIVHGTSVHACTAIHRRNRLAAETGGTVNPADLSILGKRKDDGDEDDDDGGQIVGPATQASSKPGTRRGRPVKRPRPHAPGAHGFDPNAPPFDWFTRTGNGPLDANPDIVWMLERGRYFGYRLSTVEQDPYVIPQLITPRTAEPAVARAKQELGRQKRRITGNPIPHGVTNSRNRMSNSVSASAVQLPLPAFNSWPGMASDLHPLVRQSLAAPLTQHPNVFSNASGSSNHISENHSAVPTAMTPSITTSNNSSGPAKSTSAPSGDTRPSDLQRLDTHAENTRSAGSQAVASVAKVPSSKSSKQAMAPNAKAGSHELKPGMSKATQRTARPSVAQDQETQNGIRYKRQHEQVKPAIGDTDGTLRSRKRELVKDSDDGMNPKRVKSSTTTAADLPIPSNIPKYKQPYTLEDHMVDRKQSTKRKSTGDHADGSKSKRGRVTKETSAKPSPASRTSSHRPSQLATKKTSEPTSLDPPKGLIRTHTAEARKNAKNDPNLNIMLDRADQPAKKHRAKDLPKASQEPPNTSSFVPAPKIHKRASPPSKPSPMPEATKKILESLPAAMPLPEKLAYMIQQEGPDGYFAKQSKEIAEAFGSKVLDGVQQKPRSSSSKLPPTAAFAPPSRVLKGRGLTKQGQGRERSGSIPAANSVEASVTATASISSNKQPARQESEMSMAAALSSSTTPTARNTNTKQSGSIPAATSAQPPRTATTGSISKDTKSARQGSRMRSTASPPPFTTTTTWNTTTHRKKSVTSQPPQEQPAATSAPPASMPLHTADANQLSNYQPLTEPTWTPIAATSTTTDIYVGASHFAGTPSVNDLDTTPSHYALAAYYPPPGQSYPHTAFTTNNISPYYDPPAYYPSPWVSYPNTNFTTNHTSSSYNHPTYNPPPQPTHPTTSITADSTPPFPSDNPPPQDLDPPTAPRFERADFDWDSLP